MLLGPRIQSDRKKSFLLRDYMRCTWIYLFSVFE